MKTVFKNNVNKDKGITLIALVLTAILLLIIAGVVISISLDKNSIFKRAQEATDTYTEAEIREQLQIAIIEVQVDYYLQNETGTFRNFIFSTETGKGQEKLKAILGESNLPFDSANNKITYKGYEYEIAEDGMLTKVGKSGSGEQGETITYVTRADITPQPAGGIFTSGDEVNLGDEKFFVISDDGTTVKLLAKYCLNPEGTGQLLETEDWYGSNYEYSYGIAFSNTAYWSSDFTTSPFNLQTEAMIAKARTDGNVPVGEYSYYGHGRNINDYPNAINSLNIYGTLKRAKTRLMTYNEAYSILTGSDTTLKNILAGSWGDDTVPSYGYLNWWLGDAYSSEEIWGISGYDLEWAENIEDILKAVNLSYDIYGVRPILEIQ